MINQIIITITGLLSVYLVNNPQSKYYKYACLVALVGQPSWFISSLATGQIGVQVVTGVYSIIWLRSAYKLWIKKEK